MKSFIAALFCGHCLAAIPLAEPSAPEFKSVDGIKNVEGLKRANELKAIINKERPRFEQRENIRKDLLEELDAINSNQNTVRERIVEIQSNHRELTMARDNLTMEYQMQLEAQKTERNRLTALARFIYKIRKEGFLKFVVNGENLAQLAGRIRILYRTFRSHSQLTERLDERANRLKQSDVQIGTVQSELSHLLLELNDQERLLKGYLQRKRQMIMDINEKQTAYQRAVREYRIVSNELGKMFSRFENEGARKPYLRPLRHSLPSPLAVGRIVKRFGKSIHAQFGTVLFHKGIEIEAEHNSAVHAVSRGAVEFSGWLKGLGKVLIMNHGGGLYSLCAHLFKVTKEKGDLIEQGETVGYVGDTGAESTASLYFEIRDNGKAVNPMLYLSQELSKGLT